MKQRDSVDYVIVGGGFYGCCLALFLRSISDKVMIVEAGEQLLDRASRVNQARVHSGFHYPRSTVTAVKSMVLHQQFAAHFPEAVIDDFQMLYAIATRHSKVTAKRFYRMFSDMGAPIQPASPSQAALFNSDMVEATFACAEYAFDYSVLRRHLASRLDALGIDVQLGCTVIAVEDGLEQAVVQLSTGSEIVAKQVFNVTYSQINTVLRSAGLPEVATKHELAELALVRMPPELERIGITVMDGPFFSCMPYPAERLHSLSHVRYTPHISWTDNNTALSAYDVFQQQQGIESRHRHMILDSMRFVPSLAEVEWHHSIYDVKTVLVKNEKDDGRPILFRQQPPESRVISIMGGKIDNIYDLFELIRQNRPEWANAHEQHVFAA